MITPGKALIVFSFAFIFHITAFAQQATTAQSLFQNGISRIDTNPAKAYQLLHKCMLQARRDADRDLYLQSLNALSKLDYNEVQADEMQVFSWMREAFRREINFLSDSLTADLHFNLGNYYTDFSAEVDSALFHFENALKIRSKYFVSPNERIAECYYGIGDVYRYRKYDFLKAEKSYEKALEIRERNNSIDTLKLARTYYNLATTNRAQYDFEKALSYGITSVQLFKSIDHYENLGYAYTIVGNIYRDKGESAEAKEYYHRAIALNLERGLAVEDLAWAYMTLGETFKNELQVEEALINFMKAQVIYERLLKLDKLTSDDKHLYAYCTDQLAGTYLMQKNYKKSLEHYRKHIEILKENGQFKGRPRVDSYVALGDYYNASDQLDSALYYYQKSLVSGVKNYDDMDHRHNPTEAQINFDYHFHNVLSRKAMVFERSYHQSKDASVLNLALDCLVLAERLVTKERNTLDVEESKRGFLERNYDLYEQIINVLYEKGKFERRPDWLQLTLHYFERSKSRSLFDALVRAEMLNNISRDDSLLRQQNDLTKALFSIQDKLNREEANGDAAQNATIALSREVVQIDRKIQMNKARIEERFPGYFKVKYPQIISLKDLQQTVLDSDEVILEYFWGNQNVYVIGITKEDFIFERLTAVDSISKSIDDFVVHFSTNASGLDINSFKSFSDASHHLYLQLIEPLKVFISDKSKIRVVPDGPISQVPFEVLITSSPAEGAAVNYKRLAYLIQDYTIGYAYSASMLKNESTGVLNKGSLFGMAFTAENNIKPASFDLPQLIGAGLELQALQKRFGSGKFLNGRNVTETNFKRFAPEYDIIHLAVHGKGDVDVNASSSLFFTSAGDSLEDGELHAYELYGLKLKARLAVLTSCESGLGKLYKGEGMMSMASGFAYSGCANTLMSLWKVTDQSSVELVDHFYDQLLKGRTIDEALRESKLRYLSEADEFTADPKFWASLVVYGSHDPVFEKKRSNIILIVFFIVAILLLLIFVIRWRMFYRLLRPFVTVHH